MRLRRIDRAGRIGEERSRQRGEERCEDQPAASGGKIVEVAIRCGREYAGEVLELPWLHVRCSVVLAAWVMAPALARRSADHYLAK